MRTLKAEPSVTWHWNAQKGLERETFVDYFLGTGNSWHIARPRVCAQAFTDPLLVMFLKVIYIL